MLKVKKITTIRLEVELIEKIDELCKLNNRNRANIIEILLLNELMGKNIKVIKPGMISPLITKKAIAKKVIDIGKVDLDILKHINEKYEEKEKESGSFTIGL
jgi:hypothetical protein